MSDIPGHAVLQMVPAGMEAGALEALAPLETRSAPAAPSGPAPTARTAARSSSGTAARSAVYSGPALVAVTSTGNGWRERSILPRPLIIS